MFASILLTRNFNLRKYLFLHLFKRPDIVRSVHLRWRILAIFFHSLTRVCVCDRCANVLFRFRYVKYLRRKIITSPFFGSVHSRFFRLGNLLLKFRYQYSYEEKTMRDSFHDLDNNRMYSGRKAADECSAFSSLKFFSNISDALNCHLFWLYLWKFPGRPNTFPNLCRIS